MRTLFICSAAFCTLLLTSSASADPLYTTTDLGADYTFNLGENNTIRSVTNADGTATYAFNKSVDVHAAPFVPQYSPSNHEGAYSADAITDGTHTVRYYYDIRFWDRIGATGASFLGYGGITAGWFMYGHDSPVSDFNIHGQVVGLSSNPFSTGTTDDHYAAFSDTDFKSHIALNSNGPGSPVVDNLNNYIAPIPGVYLNSAFKIDDDGQILARGSNNDIYLLTPVEQGLPAPVPEPSSVAIFSLAMLAFGYRSARRRSRCGA